MAEGERNSGVQGDLEKELTCSVSCCLFFEVGVAEEAGKLRMEGTTSQSRWKERGTRRKARHMQLDVAPFAVLLL